MTTLAVLGIGLGALATGIFLGVCLVFAIINAITAGEDGQD